jgi:phosphoglycolate phosphatase
VTKLKALLFDKDGTLFDFPASWGPWTGDFIREVAAPFDRIDALAQAVKFDLESDRHHPDSPFIAGTAEAWMDCVLTVLPELERNALREHISISTSKVKQVPVTDLATLLSDLSARGYVLGIATNDGEKSARAQLRLAGVEDMFAFIAGYDSGFGPKPEPGMLRAFATAHDLQAHEVLMIGDTRHDLDAAAAAGMPAVAVLTGYATHDDLADFAETVMPTIAHLPEWLQNRE